MRSDTIYNFKIQIRRSENRSKAFKDNKKVRLVLPDEFYYAGVGENGKDLFISETYKRKATLKKTINSLFAGVVIIDKSIPNTQG